MFLLAARDRIKRKEEYTMVLCSLRSFAATKFFHSFFFVSPQLLSGGGILHPVPVLFDLPSPIFCLLTP